MTTLEMERVKKSYGPVDVIHGVDLAIADGELVSLIGASGCGKSTLLRMVAGLEPITAGTMRLDGRTINAVAPKYRDIAMVFQNYALYPHLSVADNMGFSLKLRGRAKPDIQAAVGEAAELLGLTDYLGRYPRELSGGQRQRVAMGRAIVRQPKVFLFDEPLSNLDASLRVQMRSEIRSLQRRLGTTSIYVTHDQLEAMTMSDRIVILNQGRVEQQGAPLEVYDRPDNIFVAGFIGSPKMNFLDCQVAENGKVRLGDAELAIKAPAAAGTEAVLGIRPEHLRISDSPDIGRLPFELQLIEPTGAETHLYGRINGKPGIAVHHGRVDLREGEKLWLDAPASAMHLFSKHSGDRLVL